MSSTPSRAACRLSRVLLVAAVMTAGAALVLWQRQDAIERSVVLDVSTEIAEAPPGTIAPLAAPAPPDPTRSPMPRAGTSPAPDGDRSRTDPVAQREAGAGLSPLADLLAPRGSAIPPDLAPRLQPRSLHIGDIDLDGSVIAVGLAEDGQLEVPDETEIGWYRYGAAPGTPGATVLAAHVTWNRSLGPFFRLGELEPGDAVDVTLDDGSRRTYEVVERTTFDKDALPRNRIWRTTGSETLVLITCGGDYDADIRRYRQNIVVFAVPVAASAGAPA